jgi:hypothetical protein
MEAFDKVGTVPFHSRYIWGLAADGIPHDGSSFAGAVSLSTGIARPFATSSAADPGKPVLGQQ